MADQQPEKPVEQTVIPPEPPNEFQEAQAIREQQLKDYLGEKPEVKPAAEVKKEEPPVEPAKPGESAQTPPPSPFDAQKLEENISQRVTDNIIKAFSGKSEEQMVEESPWAKEKRNPKSYEEIATWVAHLTQKQLDVQRQTEQQAQEEAKKQQEEQLKQQKEHEATVEKETNAQWDSQWKELEGKDQHLKGKEARRNFWQQIFDFNTERSKQGVPMVINLAEFYALHYKPFNPQTPGIDAPISGKNTNSPSTTQGDDYSYRTIHNARSLSDLLPKR